MQCHMAEILPSFWGGLLAVLEMKITTLAAYPQMGNFNWGPVFVTTSFLAECKTQDPGVTGSSLTEDTML